MARRMPGKTTRTAATPRKRGTTMGTRPATGPTESLVDIFQRSGFLLPDANLAHARELEALWRRGQTFPA